MTVHLLSSQVPLPYVDNLCIFFKFDCNEVDTAIEVDIRKVLEHGLWGTVNTVTDLQGPPSERTQAEKLRDLKKLARHYARDQGSCDDVQISYLETLEDRDNDNLRLVQMLAR
jgi:hypothetical protein